jgi:hypothetical protein
MVACGSVTGRSRCILNITEIEYERKKVSEVKPHKNLDLSNFQVCMWFKLEKEWVGVEKFDKDHNERLYHIHSPENSFFTKQDTQM